MNRTVKINTVKFNAISFIGFLILIFDLLIINKKTNDSLITIQEITDFLKQSNTTKIKGLVFDNPNSSSVRYLNGLAGINESRNKNIYSFKTNIIRIKNFCINSPMNNCNLFLRYIII